ncbi:hypothetical protein ACU635_17235 [[Actinomadura] parvosata]|uniref:hypothetical protein n=1 Tax=[Actinomadura] parvosata TaxID=1955412 RepID=UPI00406C238E
MRRVAGYGAAGSMALYLVVKVGWVVAGLLGPPPEGYGSAGWVVLNAVTVVMAAAGIALGLALAQPWGRRLPAVPVILVCWVGAGFLVPMLPYVLVGSLLEDEGVVRAEEALIGVGFGGMGAGLAVAVPIYLWERWPRAFTGDGPARPSTMITVATVVGVGLGLLWVYWGMGGTSGLDRAVLDRQERLLHVSSGLWALLGAWSGWMLTRRRPPWLRRWVPVVIAFVASGSLFAWSCWKLPMVVLRPGGFVTAEYAGVAVAEHVLGIAVGLTLLAAVLPSRKGG